MYDVLLVNCNLSATIGNVADLEFYPVVLTYPHVRRIVTYVL